MALSLAQAALLSQDKLVRGVVETLLKDSPLLTKLEFASLEGNALAINREDQDNMGSAAFYGADEEITTSEGQVLPATFSLYSLIGEADVPNLYQKTRSNKNDLMAVQVKMKTKIMGHTFEDQAVYGVAASSKGFDGLHTLVGTCPTTQKLHAGSVATGGKLHLLLLDEAIDAVRAGKPSFILMNKTLNRQLSAYLRTVGSHVTERDDYGNYFTVYQGLPIITSDFLRSTEEISGGAYLNGTNGATTSVFVVYMSEGDGLCGIQNGGIEHQEWDRLEDKDASRTRLLWYVGLALYSIKAMARIDGIDPTLAVTATSS